MKVNIYETVEVSDAARKKITKLLGQKPIATRDQLKQFIWDRGAAWESLLEDELAGGAPADDPREAAGEDLIGSAEEDLIGGDGEDLI